MKIGNGGLPELMQRFYAGHDPNGNGRYLWVGYDSDANLCRAYLGKERPDEFRGLKDLGEWEISYKAFRSAVKDFGL